jgi:hypothetical protein
LISLGNLSEALGRKAHEEKVAADEARKARNAIGSPRVGGLSPYADIPECADYMW